MRQNVFRSAWMVAAAAMVIAGAFCGQAHAVNDALNNWTFEAYTAPVAAQTTSGNVGDNGGFGAIAFGNHATAATWSTPAGQGSTKSMSVNVWSTGDYYEFDLVDPQQGGGPSLNYGLQFDQVSSTTGPRDFFVQYSTDGTNFTSLPGGSYSVQPNSSSPTWSGSVAENPAYDTYNFDLRSISAAVGAGSIASNPNAKLRLVAASPAVAAQQGSTFNGVSGTNRIDNVTVYYNYDPTQAPVPQLAPPVLPVAGDIAYGIGSGRNKTTVQLIRGTGSVTGTQPSPYSPWTAQNFIRYLKFDNLGSSNSHNVHGNLLGVDPGTATAGGNIYSYATQGATTAPLPQLLSTTNAATAGTATTIGGLSVSPNNSKIALAGMTSGKVIVYDYTAGNGLGSGASLSGFRQTSTPILGTGANYATGTQQGTAWLNDTTALAFGGDGKLWTVDASTMATNTVHTATVTPNTSITTALAYNPNVSPYVWASFSTFVTTGSITTNKLFAFDPAASYAEVTPAGGIDLSNSAFAIHDLALDPSGKLFMATSGNASSQHGMIEYISGIATPGTIANDSSVDFYTDPLAFVNQNGFDIGLAAAGIAGDYNNDGKVNAADYVLWRKSPGTYGGTPAGYNTWRANFGTGGPGSGLGGSQVPEPTSAVLILFGLVGLGFRRRSA